MRSKIAAGSAIRHQVLNALLRRPEIRLIQRPVVHRLSRVAALDTWVGYHPNLEDATLPQTADIEKAVTQLLAW